MAQVYGHSANVLRYLSMVGTSRVPGTPHLGVELEVEYKPAGGPEPMTLAEWCEWNDERNQRQRNWIEIAFTHWTPEAREDYFQRYIQGAYGEYVADTRRYLPIDADTITDRIMAALDGFVILKRDGSLNNGVEIVSAPAFLAYHRRMWKPFFDGVVSGQISVEPRETCGMHVHVERSVLEARTIGQMVEFVTHPNNKPFIEKVAGRSENGYARIIEKKATDYYSADRYEAINTTPPNTVEVRIFASTVDYGVFCGRLEFVRALVSWCKEPRTSEALGQSVGFVEWVGKRPLVYKFLNQYMKGFEL